MIRTYIDIDTIAEVTRELKKTGKGWTSFGLCHRHDNGGKTLFNVCLPSDEALTKVPLDLLLGSFVHVQGSARLRAWSGEDGSLQTGLDVYPTSINVLEEPVARKQS